MAICWLTLIDFCIHSLSLREDSTSMLAFYLNLLELQWKLTQLGPSLFLALTPNYVLVHIFVVIKHLKIIFVKI